MILFPNAKINIGLNIVDKRNDGFHEIQTLMFPISLTDVLEISKAKQNSNEKIKLTISGIEVDGNNQDNLVYKAFEMLDEDYSLEPVNAHLHKSIPIGAGLGGGSADAAFMLKGLNEMFALNLNVSQLEDYAARLGSDCSFFIKNKPAYATGRGEILEPSNFDLSNYYILVVIPNETVSTKDAYSKVIPQKTEHILTESLELPVENWKDIVKNDFEESVFAQKNKIKKVKEQLIEAGATYASLSGSGAAVYGIFKNKPDVKNLLQSDYITWYSFDTEL